MQESLTFTQIEEILNSKRPDINKVNWFFELEDMKQFMKDLGNPQEKLKIIHVAGTSGKTSTCYYIAELLRFSNQTVGLTVSPHVAGINERVQINGNPIDKSEFITLFQGFIALPQVKAVQITYFGLMVAFAYWVFAKKNLDYAVIEVGMGGRLDATNVVKAKDKVCVITDIGLDHTQSLGTTLPEIAREKAGIIMENNNVFTPSQDKAVMEIFRKVCQEKHAVFSVVSRDVLSLAPVHLPLFQKRNWSLAYQTFEYIQSRDLLSKLTNSQLDIASSITVPGRMQAYQLADGRTLIVDVSHNAQKIQTMCTSVHAMYPHARISTLIGIVEGKDISLPASLEALSQISEILIITEFSGGQDIPRPAISCEKIAYQAENSNFRSIIIDKDPYSAFRTLLQQDADILLVTGSFFLLNSLLGQIEKVVKLS